MVYDGRQTSVIQACIERLRAGDQTARDALIEMADVRFQGLAHHMLQGYPDLRRYVDTCDVFNAALLRLRRALQDVHLETVLHFRRLLAVQLRRELVELARHYFGKRGAGVHERPLPEDFRTAERGEARVPARSTADPASPSLGEWSEFHEQAEALPEKQKAVFDLRYYGGLTAKATAAELDVSLALVKLRWKEAQQTLRERIQRRGRDR